MVEDDGDTETDATGIGGGAFAVIAAVEVLPSLVAVIVAAPAPMALTRPDVETMAIVVLLELQVMTRPVRRLLFASRVAAASCTVAPIWRLAAAGDTATDATGIGGGGGVGVTLAAAEPFFPSLEAMIFAEPAAMAVTTPALLTEATFVLELDHETLRPLRSFPFASRKVATAFAV